MGSGVSTTKKNSKKQKSITVSAGTAASMFDEINSTKLNEAKDDKSELSINNQRTSQSSGKHSPRSAHIADNSENLEQQIVDKDNRCEHEENDDEEEEVSPRVEGAEEIFAHTALSLGMDNDDLLFNLMYFDDGPSCTLGSMLNTIQQETIALHSENNTPYKLKPAAASAIAGLKPEQFIPSEMDQEIECAVCKDEIEVESDILRIPSCRHYFHSDCLLRWIKLQGWCPVCRAPIETSTNHDNYEDNEIEEEDKRINRRLFDTYNKSHPITEEIDYEEESERLYDRNDDKLDYSNSHHHFSQHYNNHEDEEEEDGSSPTADNDYSGSCYNNSGCGAYYPSLYEKYNNNLKSEQHKTTTIENSSSNIDDDYLRKQDNGYDDDQRLATILLSRSLNSGRNNYKQQHQLQQQDNAIFRSKNNNYSNSNSNETKYSSSSNNKYTKTSTNEIDRIKVSTSELNMSSTSAITATYNNNLKSNNNNVGTTRMQVLSNNNQKDSFKSTITTTSKSELEHEIALATAEMYIYSGYQSYMSHNHNNNGNSNSSRLSRK